MEPTFSQGEQSLAKLWAKKYVRSLSDCEDKGASQSLDRTQTADKLLSTLRFCSSQAWAKTETLLCTEMDRHRIASELIDPWKIAEDSRLLYEKAAESYKAQLTPERFSVVIAPECGRVRRHYTADDPRVLGFLSMQFHYTGQSILKEFSPTDQGTIGDYVKVMDDHLYMPLQRSYEAAAQQDYHSHTLAAVQQLLPVSTQVAESICADIAEQYPQHLCHHGHLSDASVRISSIRDVEMFQTYLCLCALEGNIASVQQELFPLCVMLYPPLNVSWELVRQLVSLLSQEIQRRLTPESHTVFAPYLKAYQEMFSQDVFPEDDPIWSNHPDVIRYMEKARNILQEVLSTQDSD